MPIITARIELDNSILKWNPSELIRELFIIGVQRKINIIINKEHSTIHSFV